MFVEIVFTDVGVDCVFCCCGPLEDFLICCASKASVKKSNFGVETDLENWIC